MLLLFMLNNFRIGANMGNALVIIDMLNDFVRKGAPLYVPNIETIIEPIKREIEKAKSNNNPVIYLCDSHKPDDKEFDKFPPHAVRNTEGAKVVDELRPKGSDIIIKKDSFLGFYNTRMNEILKKMSVDKLTITGCVTNICVFYLAIEAVSRGYKVDVIEDAVIGLNKKDHKWALNQMKDVLKVNIV